MRSASTQNVCGVRPRRRYRRGSAQSMGFHDGVLQGLEGYLEPDGEKAAGLGTDDVLKGRLGNGILDARAAFKELKKQFP